MARQGNEGRSRQSCAFAKAEQEKEERLGAMEIPFQQLFRRGECV